jgi:fructokinase
VDLGGTKIEFVALERDRRELHRHRIATPRHDYESRKNLDGALQWAWESPERFPRRPA